MEHRKTVFTSVGFANFFLKPSLFTLFATLPDVVPSLLNFFPGGGHRLVKNEQAAYEYWLRTVNCCVQAEQAYGPSVVYRLRYSDLIERSESAMRSLLAFLGEPYSSRCLEPLAKGQYFQCAGRFQSDDPAIDLAIVEEATRLSRTWKKLATCRGFAACRR